MSSDETALLRLMASGEVPGVAMAIIREGQPKHLFPNSAQLLDRSYFDRSWQDCIRDAVLEAKRSLSLRVE